MLYIHAPAPYPNIGSGSPLTPGLIDSSAPDQGSLAKISGAMALVAVEM